MNCNAARESSPSSPTGLKSPGQGVKGKVPSGLHGFDRNMPLRSKAAQIPRFRWVSPSCSQSRIPQNPLGFRERTFCPACAIRWIRIRAIHHPAVVNKLPTNSEQTRKQLITNTILDQAPPQMRAYAKIPSAIQGDGDRNVAAAPLKSRKSWDSTIVPQPEPPITIFTSYSQSSPTGVCPAHRRPGIRSIGSRRRCP